MQNYGHNKRCILANYCIDVETPCLPFFGREGHAGAGTNALSNPALIIEFAVEEIGTTVSIRNCRFSSFIACNIDSAQSYDISDHVVVSVIPNLL